MKTQMAKVVIVTLLLIAIARAEVSTEGWKEIAEGLDTASFTVSGESLPGDAKVVIVRIDPKMWDLKLLAISETGDSAGLSAKEWCKTHNLSAAINAGMYDVDYKTHVGYMKSHEHKNSAAINSYKSAAAFDPRHDNLPPFYIYDLDVTPLKSIIGKYHTVVQNLRLIKRPGENRWPQQENKWREAALGEDSKGRALFIFCQSVMSMHDFNNLLLSLPINLVCAQHLEGGPPAQMYVKHGEVEFEMDGIHETTVIQGISRPRPIPNVIGIVPRDHKK